MEKKRKSNYKGFTESRKRANDKYIATKSRISFTMEPKERKRLEKMAKKAGLSLNAFIHAKVFDEL